MATNPTFSSPGFLARVRIAAANTASDGSGTLNKFLQEDNVTEFQGNASGTAPLKIIIINSQATAAASSANVLRIYVSDSSGTNWRLYKEVPLAAATRSSSVGGEAKEVPLGDDIGQGVKIAATIHVFAGVQDQFDLLLVAQNFN